MCFKVMLYAMNTIQTFDLKVNFCETCKKTHILVLKPLTFEVSNAHLASKTANAFRKWIFFPWESAG